MRLPLVSAAEAGATAGRRARAPAGRRRVLVVDDNVDAAESLAQYLRLDAATGSRARSTASAALRDRREPASRRGRFIDLNMPRMDGAEVARRLRPRRGRARRALVALTGMGQQGDIERTREAGFDEHITKPADLQRLSRLAAG